MPPSTAATVNQFLNSKVSDVEREQEREEGQGGHLLFLIRMNQSSSSTLSLSQHLCYSCSFQAFFSSHFSLSTPHFGCPPRELNGTEEGCHFKMSPWRNKDPLTPVFFHSTMSSPLSHMHESVFHIFLPLTRKVGQLRLYSVSVRPSSAFSQLLETVVVSGKESSIINK